MQVENVVNEASSTDFIQAQLPANHVESDSQHVRQAVSAFMFDIFASIAALLLADVISHSVFGVSNASRLSFGFAFIIALLWVSTALSISLYDMKGGLQLSDNMRKAVQTVFIASMMLFTGLYVFQSTVSPLYVETFVALNAAFILGWRALIRVSMLVSPTSRTASHKRVIIIGANELGTQVADVIKQTSWGRTEVFGFVDDEKRGVNGEYAIVGGLSDLEKIVTDYKIEEVVVALPHEHNEMVNRVVLDLQPLPVKVSIVPSYLSFALFRPTVGDLGGLPLINLSEPALSTTQRLLKRSFDILVSLAVLTAASPLMAAIAIAIKLDSPGEVLFKQERIGENGKTFKMYKFRSMVQNAEALQSSVNIVDAEGHTLHKRRNDPRVTRVGKIIRKTSLDELPQFINVLNGTMSLVGPRPELPWMVKDEYKPWQYRRFAVPQGITGWWQVNGRADKPMHLNTDQDLFYVQNYSFWLDIKILFMTVPAIVKGKGAF